MLFINTPRKLVLIERDGYRYTIDISCLKRDELKSLGESLDTLALELAETSRGGKIPSGSIVFNSKNLSFAHFNLIGFTADVGINVEEE